MCRVGVIGDLHLGKQLYGYDLTPHVRRAMYDFLDLCRRFKVSVAVCLGDIYDRPTPAVPVRKMVSQWANEFQREGIDLYLLTGNHDASSNPDAPTALESLRVLTVPSCIHVVDRPTMIKGEALLLPFPSPGIYATREEYDKDVQRVLWLNQPRVVLAHLTLDGVQVGEQDFPYHSVESGLPECIGRQLVLAGHVHKPQWVGDAKLRYVVGAAERTSFAERNEARGFVVLDLSSVSKSERLVRVVLRTNALSLVQVEPDVSSWGSGGVPPTTEEIIKEHSSKVAGALVKVTPFVDDQSSVDWGRVEEGLLAAGALRVFMGPAVQVRAARRARAKTKLATAAPEVAAALYIKRRVSDKRERNRLLVLFKRMQKEAEHGTREVRG